MADFMRMKNDNPKLKQFEVAERFFYPFSTLQRYRNDKNMLSPYRIQSNNNNKRTEKLQIPIFNIDSHRKRDVKRPQLTSNNKNILKADSIHENIEINDQNLDETSDNTDI